MSWKGKYLHLASCVTKFHLVGTGVSSHTKPPSLPPQGGLQGFRGSLETWGQCCLEFSAATWQWPLLVSAKPRERTVSRTMNSQQFWALSVIKTRPSRGAVSRSSGEKEPQEGPGKATWRIGQAIAQPQPVHPRASDTLTLPSLLLYGL